MRGSNRAICPITQPGGESGVYSHDAGASFKEGWKQRDMVKRKPANGGGRTQRDRTGG